MRWLMILLTAFAACLVSPGADACGGMLFENHESRPGGMSDQQVLIAHTPKKTIVLVSVGYTGAAGGFAFLLPLQKATSQVLDGDRGLFAQLEEETAPRVIVEDGTKEPPPSSGGCACAGGGAKAVDGAGSRAAPSVVIHDRGQTQTYEYVVIGGDDAQSVSGWLEKEGFKAPAAFQSAIDGYLSKGWLFLAAKLLVAAPQGNLSPLELHFEDVGIDTLAYPFAMSAQSLAPNSRVSVTLYLAGQQAFLPVDYAVRPIDPKRLRAVSPVDSNYDALFEEQTKDGSMVIEYGARGVGTFGLMQGETAGRIDKLIGSGALLRLRAKLGPEQLKDAGFRAANESEGQQTNVFRVVWRGDGALSAKRDGSMLGWLLIGAMAIARRRRVR